MPELPEVETIRLGLEKHLVGKRIRSVEGAGGRLVRNNPQGVSDVVGLVTHRTIEAINRRGKFLWLTFPDCDQAFVVHLGMSGQVLYHQQRPTHLLPHEHLRFVLDAGGAVSFVDQRTFGHLTVSDLTTDELGRSIPHSSRHIAPDIFERDDYSSLLPRLRKVNRPIKTVLLDQHIVSGLGNIYADEALFRAGIRGHHLASSLSEDEVQDIYRNARLVMTEAIEAGGTSFDELYVDADGNAGYFARELLVYGRQGLPCPRCGAPIRKVSLQGRSHHYCKVCQE